MRLPAARLLALCLVLALTGCTASNGQDTAPPVTTATSHGDPGPTPPSFLDPVTPRSSPAGGSDTAEPRPDPEPHPGPEPASTLPGGRRTVFGDRSFLVAYYGTAGTGALGVLGETGVDRAHERLRRAARPFAGDGERVQPVYELIVTIADAHPGPDGDYAHDLARPLVRRYIRAAHRHGALLLLDLQPGRTGFLDVARRWEWALRDPWVGLALDPEWRMGRRQVPAQVIGAVGAAEVNRTAGWLSRLVRHHRLPEKLFVVHQFRVSMIHDIEAVRRQPGLAMVQHVDGFGTPGQKLATYRAVVRPRQFTPGVKLFYDEDRRLMAPAAVRRIRPAVRFVSYQ